MDNTRKHPPARLPSLLLVWMFPCIAASSIVGAMQGDTVIARVSKLMASDGAEGDEFGLAVSASGNTVIVGAVGEDERGDDAGAAYVFQSGGGAWLEVAKLTASDGEAADQFGRSVSVSGDTAIVGASRDDDSGTESGSAYVFDRSGGAWVRVETAKLIASDGAANDQFGSSVSLSGDIAIVGAPFAANNGPFSGSVYVFERRDGAWQEVAKLISSDGTANDRFGLSVSLSGNTAIVGAPFAGGAGAAYLFERSDEGWLEVAKLTASDGAAADSFGASVSISGDTVIVGANGNDDNGAASGSAYVFESSAEGWVEVAKLTASDGATEDLFGGSVSLSGDVAIVGADGDDDNGASSGSAYLFTRSDGSWLEVVKLTASDGAAHDLFGIAVWLSGDTAIVGSKGDDDNGTEGGSAYAFEGIGGGSRP